MTQSKIDEIDRLARQLTPAGAVLLYRQIADTTGRLEARLFAALLDRAEGESEEGEERSHGAECRCGHPLSAHNRYEPCSNPGVPPSECRVPWCECAGYVPRKPYEKPERSKQ